MIETDEIIEENIRRYIKEHSTTIKAYTQKYVDEKDKEIERLNNMRKEVLQIIQDDWYSLNTTPIQNIGATKDIRVKIFKILMKGSDSNE